MRALRGIVMVFAVVTLVVTYVAAGFAVCLLPPVTHGLASAYVTEDISPFNRDQLVRAADATRDFSFGRHDEKALYRTIYDLDREYLDATAGKAANEPGFPNLAVVSDANNLEELRLSCKGASERFCYTEDVVSHLEDCNVIMRKAVPVLVVCAAGAVAALVYTRMKCGRRATGLVLVISGAGVLSVFLLFGAWAALDFEGFFTTFHEVFFSQGNWTFYVDSLLICSLPTEFWMGMGVCWLVTSIAASTASVIVGWRLRKS